MGMSTGFVATFGLLPVWLKVIPRFRGAILLCILTILGLASGALLAIWSGTDHSFARFEAAETIFFVVTALGAIGLLVWVRRILPLWVIGTVYGVGQLIDGLLSTSGVDNVYKFRVAFPLTIILLSLASARRHPLHSVAALAVLGALDIFNDGRSAFAFCALAAALVIWQSRPITAAARRKPLLNAMVIGSMLLAGYTGISKLLTAGVLGAEVQARTAAQIAQSGSLLLGGRPEWTATWALMRHQPVGFGLGTVPNAEDAAITHSGFSVANVPTAEGYIDNYMLARHFELHSVVADLWSNLGPVGLLLGIAMAALLVRGLVELLSRRQAPALICFMALTSLWNLAFGPLPANLPDVAFGLGLLLLPRSRDISFHYGDRSSATAPEAPGSVAPGLKPPRGQAVPMTITGLR
jgi:hypothetical protein